MCVVSNKSFDLRRECRLFGWIMIPERFPVTYPGLVAVGTERRRSMKTARLLTAKDAQPFPAVNTEPFPAMSKEPLPAMRADPFPAANMERQSLSADCWYVET